MCGASGRGSACPSQILGFRRPLRSNGCHIRRWSLSFHTPSRPWEGFEDTLPRARLRVTIQIPASQHLTFQRPVVCGPVSVPIVLAAASRGSEPQGSLQTRLCRVVWRASFRPTIQKPKQKPLADRQRPTTCFRNHPLLVHYVNRSLD